MDKRRFEVKRGDLTIRGKMYAMDFGKKSPAVILCHGFMGNYGMCKDYAKLLAKLGYISIVFDFCGGGIQCHSDGNTVDMSVLTEMEDLRTVIEFAMNLDEVDSDSISLVGLSQGGFVAAMVAADIPNQIKALILLYPALCIPDDARRGQMQSASFDPNNIPDSFMCGPMLLGKQYPESVLNMDPNEEIRGYEGPVLLLHGTDDSLVDISYSRRAREEYSNVEYHEIAHGGHVFFGVPEMEARGLMIEFMKKIL